jgi:hypothetical protein
MTIIEFEEGALCIDATIIGKGVGIDPSLVQARMREGKITSLCERGVNADIGRYRLTFFFENRRFRLVIDEDGKVIQSSTVDFGDTELPTSMRKPGASQ